MASKLNHPSFSEIRGIFLVIIGTATLSYYYSWWFLEDHLSTFWLVAAFIMALGYGLIQIFGTWMLYLATHYRSVSFAEPDKNLTVDVFITTYYEDLSIIERAIIAARDLQGPHQTWLLDDGNQPALAAMAKRLGVEYLARSEHNDAKAGNINAALKRTQGDIIVIFDVDHVPHSEFLQRTLGYFCNSAVGFVQVMLTFGNSQDGRIAQAAADTSLDFYNPTSIGADSLRGATMMGSNALIRRTALVSIGGYQPGLAEDLATSIALHADGWQSVYVPEPLAPGMSPPDLTAWFIQQLKWSRGVFDLLLTKFPSYFSKLQTGQKLSYGLRMTYYWAGPVVGVHLLTTLLALFWGSSKVLADYENYLSHFVPLSLTTMLIRILALRRWRHPSLKPNTQASPTILVVASWSIYTIAWVMALLRVPLRFQPTPKNRVGCLHPLWLLPQIVTTICLITGILYAFYVTQAVVGLFTIGLVCALVVCQVWLLVNWIQAFILVRRKVFLTVGLST